MKWILSSWDRWNDGMASGCDENVFGFNKVVAHLDYILINKLSPSFIHEHIGALQIMLVNSLKKANQQSWPHHPETDRSKNEMN